MKFSSRKKALIAIFIFSTALANSPRIWTDWCQHGLFFGGIQLIKMRKWLDAHNLYDTNVELPQNVVCDPAKIYVRSADGSCNSLSEPAMGAAGIRFGRNVPITSLHAPTEEEIFTPDPRQISRELLTRGDFKPVSFLNMFAATWIQFMVHDWLSHGENEPSSPYLLPLASDDPFGQSNMMILRTQVDQSRTSGDASIPVTFRNENTHWWDGSQLYGSDQSAQNKVPLFLVENSWWIETG